MICSPSKLLAVPPVTRACTYSPSKFSAVEVRLTTRLHVLCPYQEFSFFDLPSTCTSKTSLSSDFRVSAWISRCFSCSRARRRLFSSSGMASATEEAGVLGRGEYLKEKTPSYLTWSSSDNV